MRASGFKRVVTGHDDQGRAIIPMQGRPLSVFPLKAVPGTVFHDMEHEGLARSSDNRDDRTHGVRSS